MLQILQVDRAGQPVQWLDLEKAACHHVKGNVIWHIGDTCATLRGGSNAKTGKPSILELKPVIAVAGELADARRWSAPSVSNRLLFTRDRHTCAYCGQRFTHSQLSMDHVVPRSRGGPLSWTNAATACLPCNHRKADRTPEEAGMPLLYLPYVPNMYEAFLLSNRHVLADQMEFLCAGLPKASRLRALPPH